MGFCVADPAKHCLIIIEFFFQETYYLAHKYVNIWEESSTPKQKQLQISGWFYLKELFKIFWTQQIRAGSFICLKAVLLQSGYFFPDVDIFNEYHWISYIVKQSESTNCECREHKRMNTSSFTILQSSNPPNTPPSPPFPPSPHHLLICPISPIPHFHRHHFLISPISPFSHHFLLSPISPPITSFMTTFSVIFINQPLIVEADPYSDFFL